MKLDKGEFVGRDALVVSGRAGPPAALPVLADPRAVALGWSPYASAASSSAG